jgi:hypothetical protein
MSNPQKISAHIDLRMNPLRMPVNRSDVFPAADLNIHARRLQAFSLRPEPLGRRDSSLVIDE